MFKDLHENGGVVGDPASFLGASDLGFAEVAWRGCWMTARLSFGLHSAIFPSSPTLYQDYPGRQLRLNWGTGRFSTSLILTENNAALFPPHAVTCLHGSEQYTLRLDAHGFTPTFALVLILVFVPVAFPLRTYYSNYKPRTHPWYFSYA